MPILHFHLAEGCHSDAQIGALLKQASQAYAQVLDSPIDRVRVFAQLYKPQHVAVAGALLSEGRAPAPFFEFLVLEGRPLDQSQQLLTVFTDLLVETLGVARSGVRGICKPVPPAMWGIAGTPASLVRAGEIEARAASASAASS